MVIRPPCIVTWAGFDGNDLSHKQNQINASYIAACDPDTIGCLWGDLNEAVGLLTILVDAISLHSENAELEPVLELKWGEAADFIERVAKG